MSSLEPFTSVENSLQKFRTLTIRLASMRLNDIFPFTTFVHISLAAVAFRPAMVTCEEGTEFAIYWARPSPIPAVPPITRARNGVGRELRGIELAMVTVYEQ